MNTSQQQREYDTIKHLLCALSLMCEGSPNRIIDLLTGYLWDIAEARELKESLVKDKA